MVIRPGWLWVVAAVGVAAIGGMDYATGVEVRIFPLYYLPISLVAWQRGRIPALVAAGVCALTWFVSNDLAGLRFSHQAYWVINTCVQGVSFVTVALLIATLRASAERERDLSRADPLTCLPNRRAFYEDGQRLLAVCRRKQRPVTVAYVDIDNFKAVNDSLGHEAGDELLRRIAGQLRAAVRPSDLTARLGGDEFAILLPETGRAAAAAALERLRASLTATVPSSGLAVTVSIGAVAFVEAPQEIEVMLQRADARMYEAKATGKNCLKLEESTVKEA